jgi:hypothetical protein
VRSLSARNGTRLWAWFASGPLYDSPVVANGTVYFHSTEDSTLYAFGLTSTTSPIAPLAPAPRALSPDLHLKVSGPAGPLAVTED